MNDKNRIRLKILGYILLCLFFIASFLTFWDNPIVWDTCYFVANRVL